MKTFNYIVAWCFFSFGLLMAFGLVPINKIFIGCMAIVCSISILENIENEINKKGEWK